MKIIARGWKRDHGAKELASGDLAEMVTDDDELMIYSRDKTYVRVLQRRVRPNTDTSPPMHESDEARVRISMSAHLSLNGRYQIQCVLTKSDITRLFHMTHAEDSLGEVASNLAKIHPSR